MQFLVYGIVTAQKVSRVAVIEAIYAHMLLIPILYISEAYRSVAHTF